MYNLVLADLYKLSKSSLIKILFGISCLCSFALAICAYSMARGTIGTSAYGFASFFTDIQMMMLLGNIIAASSICGGFESKTIQDVISSGCSRAAVLAGKFFVFFLSMLLMILPYTVTAVAGFCTGKEFLAYIPSAFLSIMEKGAGLTLSVPLLFKILAIAAVTLIVFTSQLSICLFFAFVIRKPVPVIAMGYGVMFLGGQLNNIEGNVRTILNYTPFGVNYYAFDLNAGAEDFIKAIGVSFLFAAFIFLITYFFFRRSEIK